MKEARRTPELVGGVAERVRGDSEGPGGLAEVPGGDSEKAGEISLTSSGNVLITLSLLETIQ